MKWSQAHIVTLRESPAEAEIASHQLLLRAGLVRKLGAGLYTFMPMGLRALRKVEKIIREEMDKAGALELLMPALQPTEIWETSGRIAAASDVLFKVKDSQDRPWVLGPTHEEVITSLVAGEVQSYKQLPKNFYQIQNKFRDEIRPRFGLMRAKEFLMKDAYSFDVSDEKAQESYQVMYDTYHRIFKRVGVKYRVVEADTGVMGGSFSHEFQVPAEIGESLIVYTEDGTYQAAIEKAVSIPAKRKAGVGSGEIEEFETLGVKTIDSLSKKPFQIDATDQVKTLVYIVDSKPALVLLRGDHQANEAKLEKVFVDAEEWRPAGDKEIVDALGAKPGSLGAVGVDAKKFHAIIADEALKGEDGLVTGANKDGFHLKCVSMERDITVTEWSDVREVNAGELSVEGEQPLLVERAIEVGHVFKLGEKYAKAFDAQFLDEDGKRQSITMGCYGIGVTRTLQATIEQSHDKDGIIWPEAIAPYHVALLELDPDNTEAHAVCEKLYNDLQEAGYDVLWDDRVERPGIKFKDSDLLGFPWRITVGAKALDKGGVEVKKRTEKEFKIIKPEDVLEALKGASS